MTVRSGNNAGKNPCRGFVRSAKRAKPRRLLFLKTSKRSGDRFDPAAKRNRDRTTRLARR
jgi:hypothetical protein